MARYNEIQVGRYNRALQKLFSMKGPASLESLQPELVAVLTTFYGAENRYLEGWDRFGVRIAQVGAAGNSSAAQLRNPAGSNILMVLEKVTAGSNSNINWTLSQAATGADLANVLAVTNQRLDARGRINPSAILSGEALAGTVNLAAIIDSTFAVANASYDFIVFENQELTILPGDALRVLGNLVNTTIQVGFRWRERFLEESERT